jgi:hypothetical protein
MAAVATIRIRWRTKMPNTRTTLGTLVVAALSLGVTTIGSSSAYAKNHQVHAFLPRGAYAQAFALDAAQASRRRAESSEAYELPMNARGQGVNYADYQRGGSN